MDDETGDVVLGDTAHDVAWEAFVLSLDADAVAAERYRAPSIDERPGSRKSLEDDQAHAWVVRDYYERLQEQEAAALAASVQAWEEHEAYIAAVVAARRTGTRFPRRRVLPALPGHRAESKSTGEAA